MHGARPRLPLPHPMPLVQSLRTRALLVVALATACQGDGRERGSAPDATPTAPAGTFEPGPEAAEEQREELASQTIRLIEEGRFDDARDELDSALLARTVADARRRLADGAPEDALNSVDRALELAPDDPEVRLLKADASLALAEAKIRSGGAAPGLIEGSLDDALQFYRGLGDAPRALFGASRAAWLLGRTEDGLDLARRGMAQLATVESDPEFPGPLPERIYADQVFAAYANARGSDAPDAAALGAESEDALGRLLGRAPDDAVTWSRLADLFEWEGRAKEARSAAERGLLRAPEDSGLLERLARTTRELEGSAAVVTALEAHVAGNPAIAAGRWQLAVARFQVGLDGLKATPAVLDPATFARAEAEFAEVRALDPAFASSALGYEVVCRLGRGWCAFQSGDLDTARREFLSMDELFQRGVEWSVPGELESGIQGLYRVGDAYNAKEDLLAAGEVFETLLAKQPDVALWANNAGFFLRDAATHLETDGRRLCRAARGAPDDAESAARLRALAGVERERPGSPEERAAFVAAAEQRFARARELVERSSRAYERAAELAPDDVRVVNDGALMLVYYLQRDIDRAEAILRRCIEMGAEQVRALKAEIAAAAPDDRAALETQLLDLESAWGDAHENLGVLYYTYKKDPAGALPFLQRAVEIGPDRPSVVNGLIPLVRGERTLEEDDTWDLLSWGRPCDQ